MIHIHAVATLRAIRLSSFLTALALIWGAAPTGHETRAAAQSGPTGLADENVVTVPNIISADTTWTADNTYLISGNTVVVEDVTLTVEPGTTVRFDAGPGVDTILEIRGGIAAVGTAELPIVFSSSDAGQQGRLALKTRLAVGGSPNMVEIGDADNDGLVDIVTANQTGSISFIRGRGGTFDPEIRLRLGTRFLNVASVVIADNNNDGYNALVVGVGNNLGIILWSGVSFGPLLLVGRVASVRSLAVGDVDNDGDNDTLIGATLFRWDGSTPLPQERIEVSSGSIQIADANNDGANDIVGLGGRLGNAVFTWNEDAGRFELIADFETGDLPRGLTVGDADNDGDNDLVSANFNSNDLSFIKWNGTSFDEQIRMPVEEAPTSVVVGDVDNDGDNDIIAANSGSNSVSLFRWNGTNFDPQLTFPTWGTEPSSLLIGDVDGDGLNDVIISNRSDNVTILGWTEESARTKRHGGINILTGASQADFAHCRFEFGPVLDESTVGAFSDCVFKRTGGAFSLTSGAGSNPILRCRAEGNPSGGGIMGATIIDCIAEDNFGHGILATTAVSGSAAYGNGDSGISTTGDVMGATITDCIAENNLGYGILATGTVSGCSANRNGGWGISSTGEVISSTAISNRSGIQGSRVSFSFAGLNQEIGIEATESVIGSTAASNPGVGIIAEQLTDCVISDNGAGLTFSGTALRCYIGGNRSDGVTGGVLDSCVVVGNMGIGAVATARIVNSWVLRNEFSGVLAGGTVDRSAVLNNGEGGIDGRFALVATTVFDSTISGNRGSGLMSLGPASRNAIAGNGGLDGFDYEETRFSSELLLADLSGNYWGEETTPLMNEHPWRAFFDIPRIHDFIDDTTLTEVKYENHLTEPAFPAPDQSPPAFVFAVQPNLVEPVATISAPFIVSFSKPMNTAIEPAVTFDLNPPFQANAVAPDPGWIDDKTWRGRFDFTPKNLSGTNTIRISGAIGASGFNIPFDTSNQFVFDPTEPFPLSAQLWELYE